MKVKSLVHVAVMAALITLCAWITIPTVVPFTLQTFAIFLAVGILGGKLGSLSVLVYLLLGAVGLPVFSGFSGGIGRRSVCQCAGGARSPNVRSGSRGRLTGSRSG